MSLPEPIRLLNCVTAPITAWSFLCGQLGYLRRRGFDVTLVSAPGELLDRAAQREGVAAVGVPMRREPAPLSDALTLARLIRLLRRIRPHIVHFSTPKAGLLMGLAARLCGVPIRVYTLRGMRPDGFQGFRFRLFGVLERLTCACAQRVYCVSESLRQRAIALRLAPPEKLRVLASGSSNGVDCVRFSRSPEVLARAEQLRAQIGLPPDVPVIGFVGRLVRDKGAAELLAALRILRQSIPQLHLLFVGWLEQYDGLSEEHLAALRVDPQVIATGALDDTAPAYALVDVIALPTYREGFPNVPLEAAALGVPTVATRVTGCVDAVVDGVTGALVPARDAEALAAALRSYLLDADLRRRHGAAAQARAVAEFRPEAVWEALHQEYRTLLRELESPGLPE